MRTSVIILNYKTFEKTIDCVNSLSNDKELIDYIIIIDNGSGNNSLKKIQTFLSSTNREFEILNSFQEIPKKRYILYQNPQNLGYAKGNNVGIKIALNAKSDYILIINNDIKIYPNAILNMLNFIQKNTQAGCVGPVIKEGESYDYNFARRKMRWYDYFLLSGVGKKIIPIKNLIKHHYFAYTNLPSTNFEVDIISGSCMLFPAWVLKRTNGFDENTFLFYEEAIMSKRLEDMNLKTYVIVNSFVEHEHAGSIKKIQPSIILKHSLNSQLYYLNTIRNYNILIAKFIMIGQYLTYYYSRLKERIIR